METLLNKKHLLTFEFDFSEQKPLPTNPMFSYGKARILYTEHNRNDSYFSRDSVQKALPTLYGIPIVGEFDEETGNFKGHGGKVEISDDGVKFIDTTMPFGYISEESNFSWETVLHKDGSTKEYLVADKCVFWTGRYPQLNGLFKYGKYNQSMEIEVTNGEFAVIDGQETFRIDDFVFSALCILGIETEEDPEGRVEPCFEEASIGIYSNQSTFSNKFKFMLEELNNPTKAGGQEMPNENKTSFTSKQLFVMLSRALGEMKDMDFKYQDHTENLVIFSDKEDKVFEAEFSITEEALTIDIENKKDSEFKLTEDEMNFINADISALEQKLETVKSEFAQLEADKVALQESHEEALNTINSDFEAYKTETATKLADLEVLQTENQTYKAKAEKVDALESELATLKEYKRKTEEDSIKEKFSGKLEADILNSIIQNNNEKSVEEIESLIFAEIGKANFSAKSTNKNTPSGISVPAGGQESTGFYAQLKEKHFANKQ